MTYQPKPETANWQAPPGVAPWRELSDEEYERLDAEFGGLERWYERVKDEKPFDEVSGDLTGAGGTHDGPGRAPGPSLRHLARPPGRTTRP